MVVAERAAEYQLTGDAAECGVVATEAADGDYSSGERRSGPEERAGGVAATTEDDGTRAAAAAGTASTVVTRPRVIS